MNSSLRENNHMSNRVDEHYHELTISESIVRTKKGLFKEHVVKLFPMGEESLSLRTNGFYEGVGVIVQKGDTYEFYSRNSDEELLSQEDSIKFLKEKLSTNELHQQFLDKFPNEAKGLGLK